MKSLPITPQGAPDPIEVLRKGLCCPCSQPLTGSQFMNIIITRYRQTWPYPCSGNVLTGEAYGASAILCDRCLETNAHIHFVIELKDGAVIRHPVHQLEKLCNSLSN